MGLHHPPSCEAFMDAVHAVLRDASEPLTCIEVARMTGQGRRTVKWALEYLVVDRRVREHRNTDGYAWWWSAWPDTLDADDLEAAWSMPAADRA